MDILRRDLHSAFVAMRRAPGFAATTLLTLALGIGSTTAVFSIVHGVLLQPLPYADADRLVRVWEEYPGGVSPAGNRWLSRTTYAAWRQQPRTLESLGGYAFADHQVTFAGEGIKLFGAQISPAVLATLGVRPALGRLLSDDDDREGTAAVVVVSHELWRERYGSSPTVLGTTLTIDGLPHTIVGVAPPGFEFPDSRTRFWLPYVIPRTSAPATAPIVFSSLARLKPGATLAQAEAEGTAIARGAAAHRLTELFFGKGGPVVVHARPLGADMTAQVRPALAVLSVAVALVLLIACANVTNLLLSRGLSRERELAIRAAIGASRGRIVRQLFTESAVVSLLGSTLGLGLARWLVRLLPLIAPPRLPRLEQVALDGSVVMFWALTSLATTIAAALAPAARGARADVTDVFRGGERASSGGFRSAGARRLRDSLLILEAAFAVLLIVGASLLARSFARLTVVDNGYTAPGVLIASVELPPGATEARTDQFIDAALARLRGLSGVSAAGAGAMVPLMARTAVAPFSLPETLTGGKPAQGRALVYWITPGYAEALGLRLRYGRFLADGDRRAGTMATLVNEEFVRRHLAAREAIGLRIPHLIGQDAGVVAEIVGVVGDVLKDGNDRQPQPELYFIHGGHGNRISGTVNLVIRSSGSLTSLAADVRGLVRQIDREAVVDRLEPLTTTVAASLDAPRFAAEVVSGFAIAAMLLAAIGLHGVLSYSVAQRVGELGIRAALGAGRADLVRLVLGEGLAVVAVGTALGIAAAAVSTRLMQDLLFGVAPLDPAAFAVAPAVLLVAALAACLGPALRAASVDPATTLRR